MLKNRGGIAKSLVDWGKEKWTTMFNGQPNPSYLMRRRYGGKGVNGGEPVQFGAAGIVANLEHESNFNTKAIGIMEKL